MNTLTRTLLQNSISLCLYDMNSLKSSFTSLPAYQPHFHVQKRDVIDFSAGEIQNLAEVEEIVKLWS